MPSAAVAPSAFRSVPAFLLTAHPPGCSLLRMLSRYVASLRSSYAGLTSPDRSAVFFALVLCGKRAVRNGVRGVAAERPGAIVRMPNPCVCQFHALCRGRSLRLPLRPCFRTDGTPSGVLSIAHVIPACRLPSVVLCRVNITRPLRGLLRACVVWKAGDT